MFFELQANTIFKNVVFQLESVHVKLYMIKFRSRKVNIDNYCVHQKYL